MSCAVLLASTDEEALELISELQAELQAHYPEITVLRPDDAQAAQAEVAACWYPDPDLLKAYPNIKVLQSIAAGIDHLGKATLGSGLPVCRIVDDEQKRAMFEYILWGVLNVHRKFDIAQANQSNKHWARYSQRSAAAIQIGLLGLGELGGYVAQRLSEFGYSVAGWSRSQKTFDGVTCYSAAEGLDELLKQSEIIVNLLPLSTATSGILNRNLLNKMPRGGYVINCGRGGHLIRDDLIDVIHSGQLQGALLDVFDEEPLPDTDPLWEVPGVIITPHVASDASVSTIARHVAANALRHYRGEPLENQVDLTQGY
jgi:glyoxylate/hydroxypyruvate reductase A